MILQRTIKTPVELSGIGLHSGANIRLRLRPASADTGIIFHRREGDRVVAIKVKNTVN